MQRRGWLLIWLVVEMLFLAECAGPDDDWRLILQDRPTPVPATTTISRETKGTASVTYLTPKCQVTCADPAAEYRMILVRDGTLPNEATLQDPLPKNAMYFRLEIMAVIRILKDNACLVRDDSDDRQILKVEGYYDGKLNVLKCSRSASVDNNTLGLSQDMVADGGLACVYSDQMKETFAFKDLRLI